MSRICFDWCELDHEHSFGSSVTDTIGTNRVTLTERERKSFQMQLGKPVYDMHDVKRELEAKNFEVVSQTGSDAKFRKELREWSKEPEGRRGPPPKPSR